jgi:glycosyltransferase involved in cell wall biosynthesis
MTEPLVTVVCLCFNHQRFVRESIASVLNQSYKNIQLIVVDDASTDESALAIKQMCAEYASIELVLNEKNVGSCKAFNSALKLAKGDFLIDLSADDILLPNRVEEGVRILIEAGDDYGAQFGDAEIIDESGKQTGFHSDKFPHGTVPQGDIYKEFINRYFICPPSVMFTRALMNEVNGYDENLSYEDFDIYIRSSRKFNYIYTPSVLVKRRITSNALSTNQFKIFSKHSESTFKVCEKILALNKNRVEQQALGNRIQYEIKLNLRLLNLSVVLKFMRLWLRNNRMVFQQ